jgi:hypothetical protein
MTEPTDITEVGNLPSTSEDAAREAREQADAYDSLFAPIELPLDDGDSMMIPPHPDYGMLDDPRMEAYTELMFEVDTEYEREPDIIIPEQEVDGGIRMPGEVVRGKLKVPYRRLVKGKSVLVKPPHSIGFVQAVLGEDEYKRLRAGGKGAKDVWKIWADQSVRIKERQLSDRKSQGSSVAVAPVPASNRK